MKANKEPEKIYYHKGKLRTPFAVEQRLDETDVEYTRTDAFIEKAVKWIRESVTNNPECNRILSKKGIITIGGLIEDFKNYMK